MADGKVVLSVDRCFTGLVRPNLVLGLPRLLLIDGDRDTDDGKTVFWFCWIRGRSEFRCGFEEIERRLPEELYFETSFLMLDRKGDKLRRTVAINGGRGLWILGFDISKSPIGI